MTVSEPGFVEALAKVSGALAKTHFSREMEQNCTPVLVVGWEDFPTRQCSYRIAGMGTTTSVVLLDAEDKRLHRWIASACMRVATKAIEGCAKNLARHIQEQSGGQFPVSGIVMEDMDRNGVANAYPFRNGVTVSLAALSSGQEGDPTAEQTAAGLVDPPLTAKKYARIAGTTRAQFRALVPGADVSGLGWLTTVRTAYQDAWNKDENLLISAWALANATDLGGD